MINISEKKLPCGEGYLYTLEITTPQQLEFNTVQYFIQLLKQELTRRGIKYDTQNNYLP
jgi:hypothetical protein